MNNFEKLEMEIRDYAEGSISDKIIRRRMNSWADTIAAEVERMRGGDAEPDDSYAGICQDVYEQIGEMIEPYVIRGSMPGMWDEKNPKELPASVTGAVSMLIEHWEATKGLSLPQPPEPTP